MARKIQAFYTEDFIRIYQAYNKDIANIALRDKRFVLPPFKLDRTTWVKPSFLWMMFRSGWALKTDQERILAIDISHHDFLWILEHSCLSHFDPKIYKSESDWKKIKSMSAAVIQWDPERDIFLNRLKDRTIQIGIVPPNTEKYASQWILNISDLTDTAKKIKKLVDNNKIKEANRFLPLEKEDNVPNNIQTIIGMGID
jgi:hypothetical protein